MSPNNKKMPLFHAYVEVQLISNDLSINNRINQNNNKSNNNNNTKAKIILEYPCNALEKNLGLSNAHEVLPSFCFPDKDELIKSRRKVSEEFTFVLTDSSGGRVYGFCRRILDKGIGYRYICRCYAS